MHALFSRLFLSVFAAAILLGQFGCGGNDPPPNTAAVQPPAPPNNNDNATGTNTGGQTNSGPVVTPPPPPPPPPDSSSRESQPMPGDGTNEPPEDVSSSEQQPMPGDGGADPSTSDPAPPEEIMLFSHKSMANGAVLSGDGKTLIEWEHIQPTPQTAQDVYTAWNVQTGEQIAQWKDDHVTMNLAPSRDGRVVVSAGFTFSDGKRQGSQVRTFALPEGNVVSTAPLSGDLAELQLAVTADGGTAYVVAPSRGMFAVDTTKGAAEKLGDKAPFQDRWAFVRSTGELFNSDQSRGFFKTPGDFESGKLAAPSSAGGNYPRISADRRWLVSSVSDFADGKSYGRIMRFDLKKDAKDSEHRVGEWTIRHLALSDDGRYAAVGGTGDLAVIYDFENKTPINLELTHAPVAFTPGGALVLRSFRDKYAFVHPATGQQLTTPLEEQWFSSTSTGESTIAQQPKPDFSLTAKEFAQAFETDVEGARARFDGKQIELTGKVTMFDVSYSGGSYVFLDGSKFVAVHDEPWELALPGQTVKATGKFNANFGVKLTIVEAEGERNVIQANELASQFARNEEATGKKYDQQWMEIRGEMVRVEKDEFGGCTLVLKGTGGTDVHCLVGAKYADSLKPGDTARLAGQFSKSSSPPPTITQCNAITAPITDVASNDDPQTPKPPDEAGEPPALRTWTSADGKFSVEAELVKVIGPKVFLKRTDGSEIQVPIDKLSEDDITFIKRKR